MAIEIQLSRPIQNDAAAGDLIELLKQEYNELGLDEAIVYYGYPRYRDDDNELIAAQTLIMSPQHGVVIFGTLDSTGRSTEDTDRAERATESVFALENSKLLANKALRQTPVTLKVPISAYIYAPHLEDEAPEGSEIEYIGGHVGMREIFGNRNPQQSVEVLKFWLSFEKRRGCSNKATCNTTEQFVFAGRTA
jgi:hypothetical protein